MCDFLLTKEGTSAVIPEEKTPAMTTIEVQKRKISVRHVFGNLVGYVAEKCGVKYK